MVKLFQISQISLLFICFLPFENAFSDSEIAGHIKQQSTLMDGQLEHQLDARLNTSFSNSSFEFVLNTELLVVGNSLTQLTRLSNDKSRFLNLSTEVIEGQDFESVIRVDRLYFSVNHEDFKLNLGRQALSWGNGMLFQVLDPFNPFSPTTVDKNYKTGEDMVFTLIPFSGGDDLQLLIVPRRDSLTNTVKSDQSSFAAKWHDSFSDQELDIDLILARHFDETLFGFGFSKTVDQAVLRSDVSINKLENGEVEISFVVNSDYSWVFLDKNFYGFIEFFHSALGVPPSRYLQITPVMIDRLSRGELFTIGEDYLGTGIRIEYFPWLNHFVNVVGNLHDQSGFIQTRFEIDALQDFLIFVGLNQPWGKSESEFRSNDFFEFDTTGYLRLVYFF